ILILSLALYVVDTSFTNSPLAELVNVGLVQNVLMLGAGLFVLGIVMRIFDKTAGKVLQKSSHCRVCNTVIPNGQIYCRVHLRGMLEREDRKTHSTRIR
ncbi:MAG TPA: hypothetical protein VIM68_03270, partial [Thermoanaerobaculia bacterium]